MQQQNAFLPPKLTQNIRKRCMHVLSPNEFVSVSGAKPCIRKNSQAATLLLNRPRCGCCWQRVLGTWSYTTAISGYEELLTARLGTRNSSTPAPRKPHRLCKWLVPCGASAAAAIPIARRAAGHAGGLRGHVFQRGWQGLHVSAAVATEVLGDAEAAAAVHEAPWRGSRRWWPGGAGQKGTEELLPVGSTGFGVPVEHQVQVELGTHWQSPQSTCVSGQPTTLDGLALTELSGSSLLSPATPGPWQNWHTPSGTQLQRPQSWCTSNIRRPLWGPFGVLVVRQAARHRAPAHPLAS